MRIFRYLKKVSTLKLNTDKCVGCGMCKNVCPHAVFDITEGKAHIIDLDGCMECGACSKNCPVDALSVTPGVGCASYIIQRWYKGDKAECGCCDSGSC
ncbi:MAG: 4Fe-4S binding protein [Deltaproteobacteria bacterium]|jgi:NAD-dependent dihydropyrimidine dehydrogenase PreA subunit|nr:4Fe-4S binding protein [Deltaproteobacteria bacterium]